MGYRRNVTIFCQKKVYEEIINKCKKNDFMPDKIMREKDGPTYNYKLDWEWVKWYDTYPAIRAIDRVLTLADEEEAMYDYKQLILGEDDDIEIYEHGTTFSEVYVVPKILYDDVNYENYIEHIDYDSGKNMPYCVGDEITINGSDARYNKECTTGIHCCFTNREDTEN